MKRLLLHVAVVLCTAVPATAKTTVTFEERAVIARVTPGAGTAWVAVIHDWKGYELRILQRATVLTDDDGDGVIRLELDRRSELDSVWVVVDLANGDAAIETPPGVSLRRRPLPPAAINARGAGRAAHISDDQDLTMFMVVRPGVGAWIATVEDGSALDGDGVFNRRASAVLERMTPLGPTPAPNDFQRGDIVAVVAPMTLAIADGRVTSEAGQ